MEIRIKRAGPECVEGVAVLFDAYRVFYQQPSNLATSRAFISERMAQGESVIFYAQDQAGNVLGFTQLYPTFSSVTAQRTWLLNDLYTVEAARGKGVGKQLLEAAREFAVASGAAGILLETGRGNEGLGYVRDEGYYTYYLGVQR